MLYGHGLSVSLEIIEYGLPAALLQFQGMSALCFKLFYDLSGASLGYKQYGHLPSIAQCVFKSFLIPHLVINTAKIKPHAPVLRFHPERKATANA